MIEFLFQQFGFHFYDYLDIASIGTLYNTNHRLREIIHDFVCQDEKLIFNSCSCNICDGDYVDNPFLMNAHYSECRIKLVCSWYYAIIHHI